MLQNNFVKNTLNCSPTFVRQFILSDPLPRPPHKKKQKKKKSAEQFNKSLMIFLIFSNSYLIRKKQVLRMWSLKKIQFKKLERHFKTTKWNLESMKSMEFLSHSEKNSKSGIQKSNEANGTNRGLFEARIFG